MTSQLSAIREIEESGGIIRCSIRSGNHKVTIQAANGQLVIVSDQYRFDFVKALKRFNAVKSEPVKAATAKQAVERPRTRRNARTRVVTPRASTPAHSGEQGIQQPAVREQSTLRDQLKARNAEYGAT